LLSSVPSIDGKHRERVRLVGEIPSASRLPKGCVFHTRCTRKIGRICEDDAPQLKGLGDGHEVRCHIAPDNLPRVVEQAS
jgi:peptide/nickel transport system ATP-binding protein